MLVIMICIILAGILGGGYFVSVSALIGIFLAGVLFYRIYYQKSITAAWDLNMSALAVLFLCHLAACMWAIDSGMALMGAVKFLPLLYFYIAVSGKTEEQEKLIELLPLFGNLMTLFSFVMMQFPVFKEWISVAGRLSGFFQYPNTYALFMLICLILVIWRFDFKKPDWMVLLYGVGAVFGILMSGSRTVFVLTIFVLIWSVVKRISAKKTILAVLICGGISAAALAIIIGGETVLGRFANISVGASTFLGRLLYAQDALPVIIRNPLGLGYYGYYFHQQSIQTGVYSVVNAHNELLQIMLDAGILPAILLSVAVLRSIFSRQVSERNRLILVVMVLHSLMDYDFQFLVMGFVLILFLEKRNIKTFKVPVFTKSVVGIAGTVMLIISVLCGLSEFCYTSGRYEMACRIYKGNTMAELQLITRTDDVKEMKRIAESILQRNQNVSLAYSAVAQCSFSEGNVTDFINYKEKAIELAPYQFEEYVNYLEILAYCAEKYMEGGDITGAEFCVEKAEKIPQMLEMVKENTSVLGWKIVDRPQVTLSHEHLELLKEMRRGLNE